MSPVRDTGDRPALARWIAPLRVALVFAGGASIALAVFADRWGLGSAGSVGLGQGILACVGALALLAGVLGQRFPRWYREAAVLCASSLLLLALLELGAIAIGRLLFRSDFGDIEGLSYYRAQDWSRDYWREALLAERMRYEPYLGWRHRPFHGETLQIDANGIRRTPGADCSEGAYRLWAYGGSTLQGWGSPDWATIPAFLQQGLEARRGPPVCVSNMGEDGFVSTQETVALLLRLQVGDVPGAVVFYDGINETIAAAESGRAGVHVTLAPIAARFEQSEHPLLAWLRGTRLHALVSHLRHGALPLRNEIVYRHPEVDPVDLGRRVAKRYLGNVRLVRSLGAQYGFDSFFFLQPHLALTQKPLTSEEQPMRDRIAGPVEGLAAAFYRAVRAEASRLDGVWDLSDVLDDQTSTIWIDATGHITPEGNRLVAREILRRLDDADRLARGVAEPRPTRK